MVRDEVEECEGRLADMSGRAHAMLAPRATTALLALLRALDLPAGSEVLMPAVLCANAVYAVRWAGLRPVFADVSLDDFNLDLRAAQAAVGPDMRVLLAVPLFGHPLNVPGLLEFANRHSLILVEDAAQAVGLRHGERPAGSVGLASVYSFGAGKIADAGGGAALLSDDSALLDRARSELAAMPSTGANVYGTAAGRILRALEGLPEELEARRRMVSIYRQALDLPGLTHPHLPYDLPLWKYSLLVPTREHRDRVTRELLVRGVEATNLYPPLPQSFPEACASAPANFPVAWDVYHRIVNLPLWPQPAGLAEKVAAAFQAA
jgi:dTDP-4-amino-4,6-dideoxygalactose transaminase